ncbi:MAG: adenosylcobinamide-phosphate synthase CbiB [Pseudomonadota bacterium]
MFESSLLILLIALILDWVLGEPPALWSRFPHPIVLFGKAVAWADSHLNLSSERDSVRYKKGAVAIALLILIALIVGLFLTWVVAAVPLFGVGIEAFVVFVLLAQRSLFDHVSAVCDGMKERGLIGGQEAVGMIVGRDPKVLDKSGVSRAAIESLAENFSDGVVAPAFWYVIFGLPGILVYKMINTADSMIAYRNEKYLWFGRATAQIDDLANWVPARLSAIILAFGAALHQGLDAAKNALRCAWRDAGLHRSPNAGWPEAAMAGAINIALGGPRQYSEEAVLQPYINASGRERLEAGDIDIALGVFSQACYALWAGVLVLLVLF